jgi:hypothetical protein
MNFADKVYMGGLYNYRNNTRKITNLNEGFLRMSEAVNFCRSSFLSVLKLSFCIQSECV